MKTHKPQITPIYQLYQKMLHVAGPARTALLKGFVFTAIACTLEALALLSLYPIIERVMAGSALSALLPWLALLVVLLIGESFFRAQEVKIGHSEHYADFGRNLKLKLGEKLRRIALEKLDDKRTGELTHTIASNVEDVVMLSHVVGKMFLRPVIVPLVCIIGLLFIDWRVSVLMVLLFPMAVPIYFARRRYLSVGLAQFVEANRELVNQSLEYTQGIAVLRATNCVGDKSVKLNQSIDTVCEYQKIGMKKSILPQIMLSIIVELGLWIVMFAATWWVLQSSMTLATLVLLMVIVTRFAEPVTLFIEFSAGFELFEKGVDAIDALHAMPDQQTKPSDTTPEGNKIVLTNVSYRYPDTTASALNNISLTIPERSMTALVGASGCGKTTLTRMLMRYGELSAGSITLGGVDIETLTPDALMQHFSVVFQDVYLFDDTVLNNIRMGKPDASDEEVRRAAQMAHCDEFISRLSDGYNTIVGGIGGKLSGGEKQRISIARAILKDTPIVILDEPTSALDTESEVAVQRAIDELVAERTVIVIAHRLSTIIGADTIVVMDEGKIIETGTHASLIEQGGRFASLWHAQQQSEHWQSVKD